MMQISRKLISKVAGILCSLFVVGICVLPIYDLYIPWPVASHALQHYGGHYRLCVGISYESSTTTIKGRTTSSSIRQRAFVVIRNPIALPRLVIVSQDQDGQVTLEESVFGFWFWLVVSGGMTWGAWHFGLRPLLQIQTIVQRPHSERGLEFRLRSSALSSQVSRITPYKRFP